MFEKDEDYRKARKESKDRITKVIKFWIAREETLHDEGFQKGAEFGYNKANEWHYVKDGDFPKYNNEVLCLLWGGIKEIGYYKNEMWYFEDFTADKDDVDYWQEIKLPKESE